MRQPYRHDIDGLRAVAVLSVLAYHYQLGPIAGGFIGVDVFFVISGYLITSQLKTDIESGSFSILSFYDRRIRRIVPPLLIMLIVTLCAGWFFLMPGDYADLGESSTYATFGLGNLYFLWHTGYFDQAADLRPLLHTWSLGVEEQFYLVWPPLLWLGITLVRSRRLFVFLFAIALSLSFAYAIMKVQLAPKEAFYLAYPRAWELGIGGILAFLPPIRDRQIGALLEIAGLSLLGWSFFVITSKSPFPGYNAIYACLGTAFLIWPKPGWIVAAAFSLSPMRAIGLISYSLYLWHWPILVLFKNYNNGVMPTATEAIALILLSSVLAGLSLFYIEQPIRRARPIRWRTIAVGLSCCALVASASLVVFARSGFEGRVSSNLADLQSLDVMWKWKCPQRVSLDGHSYCSFGPPWSSAKVHAVLWGDSHALVMAPILQAAYSKEPVSFILYPHCPAVLGNGLSAPKSDEPDYSSNCKEEHKRAYRLLLDHKDIRLVVFASSWPWLGTNIYKDGHEGDKVNGPLTIANELRTVISDLKTAGRDFVIVSDWPQLRNDPIGCEIGGQSGLIRASCNGIERAIKVYFDSWQFRMRDLFAKVAKNNANVQVVFPDRFLCNPTICSLRVHGEYLYRDAGHLRRNLSFATRIALGKGFGFPIMPSGTALATR